MTAKRRAKKIKSIEVVTVEGMATADVTAPAVAMQAASEGRSAWTCERWKRLPAPIFPKPRSVEAATVAVVLDTGSRGSTGMASRKRM